MPGAKPEAIAAALAAFVAHATEQGEGGYVTVLCFESHPSYRGGKQLRFLYIDYQLYAAGGQHDNDVPQAKSPPGTPPDAFLVLGRLRGVSWIKN